MRRLRPPRPRLAPRLGVLSRLRSRRFPGVLALGRREARPPRPTGLVLARRPRVRGRFSLRVHRVVEAKAPQQTRAPDVPSAPTSRLVLRGVERAAEVRTARERVEHAAGLLERSTEHAAGLLERSTERLLERRERTLPALERLAVREDRAGVHERATLRTTGSGADGRDGADAYAQRPELVLRFPSAPPGTARTAGPPASAGQSPPTETPPSPSRPLVAGIDHALSEPMLSLLTDQVLWRIERRAIAQRERLGIV